MAPDGTVTLLALTPEQIELENALTDVVLGGGLVRVSHGGKAVWLAWPSLAEEKRIERRAEQLRGGLPEEALQAGDLAVTQMRAVIEVLARPPFEDWLPLGPEGRPATGRLRSRALLLGLQRGWRQRQDEFLQWLDAPQNMQRLTRYPDLALRDQVARELGTHPFDKRIDALSRVQMYVLLHLRHPPVDAHDQDIAHEQELLDAAEEYTLGALRYGEAEETPQDADDFAIAMQR